MSIERVPLEPEVFTKPLDVRLESAGIEAELLMVSVERLPVVEKRLVELAVVEKRLVVVALVVVELPLTNKFPVILKLESMVDEAVERKPLERVSSEVVAEPP